MWKLFIDDDCDTVRDPSITVENPEWRAVMGLPISVPETKSLGEWVFARTATQAISEIERRGMPDFISFDHDLGDGKDGMYVVNWIIDEDIKSGIIPDGFDFEVHSANPIGRRNIREKLSAYIQFMKSQATKKGL